MRVQIEKMVYGGAGLARTEDGVIFVHGAAPGDVLEVRIVERKKDYANAEIESIVEASPHRQTPECPNYGTAGCCHWDHLRYASQVQFKEDILRESLRRQGRIDWSGPIPRQTAEPAGYRLRASLHNGPAGIGFVQEQSHRIVPISSCKALAPDVNRFVSAAGGLARTELFRTLSEVHVAAWGDRTGSAWIFSGREDLETETIRDRIFELEGTAQVSLLNGEHRVTYGEPLAIEVAGIRYALHPDQFFQANRFLLSGFLKAVVALVGAPTGTVLELFAGTGFFTIPATRVARHVISVEASSRASRIAAANARTNGASNAEFFALTAEAFLREAKLPPIQTVLLNPPRTGAGKQVIRRIAEIRAKRVVYVSCNPAEFAHEASMLISAGYALSHLQWIDQFPGTYHLELIGAFDLT